MIELLWTANSNEPGHARSCTWCGVYRRLPYSFCHIATSSFLSAFGCSTRNCHPYYFSATHAQRICFMLAHPVVVPPKQQYDVICCLRPKQSFSSVPCCALRLPPINTPHSFLPWLGLALSSLVGCQLSVAYMHGLQSRNPTNVLLMLHLHHINLSWPCCGCTADLLLLWMVMAAVQCEPVLTSEGPLYAACQGLSFLSF